MLCLLADLIQVFIYVVIAGALLSWFPTQPGGGLAQLRELIGRVTDPVMVPVRRAIPASFGGIDFSPIIVIIGLSIIAGLLC